VPYAHSEECERQVNACTGLPTHVAPDEHYVRTWPELRAGLRSLLQEQNGTLEVSQVKSLFRTRLRTELSETVFGHQCLSKLLGDQQLQEEFALETIGQGNRYVLRPKGEAASQAPQRICLALATAVEAAEEPAAPGPGA